jgi:hypothetical protein
LDARIADLTARVASTSDKQEAASQFTAEIDARFAALRRSMRELRASTNPGFNRWRSLRQPPRRHAAISVRLRASLDELSRIRSPGGGRDHARIDRIEQAMAQYKSPGAIRGSIHASGGAASVSRLG